MEYYARLFSRVRAPPVATLRESFPLTPETEEAVTPSVSRIGIGATVLPINRGVEGRRQRWLPERVDKVIAFDRLAL